MAEYRLSSSPSVHTPGGIAWAINGYAFEPDRAQILKIISSMFPALPQDALKQLLAKDVDHKIEGETVVFSAEA